jgi:hypothetical protein
MTMKVFSPSVPRTQPSDLWSVVGLGAQDGIALMGKIRPRSIRRCRKAFFCLDKNSAK